MQEIASKLVQWFRHNQRILPWRDNPEPYRVWISEIMLQQTRVQAVLPYYDRFLARFPDICALAEASQEEVLLQWQGLGYYSRARNLHKTAQIIKNKNSCQFPDTYASVLNLPGIGKYTAAAILSIAFDQAYPVIDGNVLRVMARLFSISTDIRLPATEKTIEGYLSQIFPQDQASDFNQGMMELGALICIPKQPSCDLCPLSSACEAYRNNLQLQLPVRMANPKPLISKRILFMIKQDDKFLIHLQQPDGMLASMWEFPGVEGSVENAEELFNIDYGFNVSLGMKLLDAEHVFTHKHWKMIVYEGSVEPTVDLDAARFKWVRPNELKNYPIPNAFQAIVKFILGSCP